MTCFCPQRLLVFAAVLLLLAGCGRNDQFGDELTPQPDTPTQNAAVAPAVPETPAEGVYPGPDAAVASDSATPDTLTEKAYPDPDAVVVPEYVNPNVTPDKAYPGPQTATPEPPTVTPAPGDDQGFVDYPAGEIGVIIDSRNNTVVEVIENSPAQAAGIKVGDVITQVEDKSVGDKFKDAKEKMRDKLNKQVKVEIERQGKKSILNMKTDVLIFPTVAPDQPTPTPVYDPFIYL